MNTPSVRQTICAVIPTLDRGTSWVTVVRGLLMQSRPPDEIIIVDQNDEPSENTLEAHCISQRGIRLLHLHDRVASLPKARNTAARWSRSDLLLYLDDDVHLPLEFIETLALEMNRKEAHLISAIVLDVNEPLVKHNSTDVEILAMSLSAEIRLQRGVPYVRGGAHLIMRSLVHDLGGYSEAFLGPANYEETDLGLRAIASGYKIASTRRTGLLHLKLPSGGCRIVNSARWNEKVASWNFLLFLRRHPSLPLSTKAQLIWLAIRSGPLRRNSLRSPVALLYALAMFVRNLVDILDQPRALSNLDVFPSRDTKHTESLVGEYRGSEGNDL
jgi:GT2 family glycosyltransferase